MIFGCSCRYFQHTHFITIVGVGKRGEYLLVHGDAKTAPVTRTTLRFTGEVYWPCAG